jgi:hypothetical protein
MVCTLPVANFVILVDRWFKGTEQMARMQNKRCAANLAETERGLDVEIGTGRMTESKSNVP